MPAQTLGRADLLRLYAFGVLDNFWLSRAVWVLFLLHRGFSLTEVAFCEAALHLTAVALELPVGRLADRIGRKYNLAFGGLCAIIAGLFYLHAPSFAILLLAFVFDGAASTFRSSSQEALFYDTCKAMGRHRDYPQLYGQFAAATMASILVGEVVGGILSEWSFPAIYWIQMGAALLATLTILGAREPALDRTAAGQVDRRGILASVRLVLSRPRLRVLLAYHAVFWTLVNLVVLYGQHLFAEQGASRGTIGLIYGAASLAGVFAAYRAYRMERFAGERRSLVGALGLAVAGVLMVTLMPAPWSYLGFGVFYLASDFMEPVLSDYVNREIPSYSRATILSLFSLTMSLGTAVLTPVVGLLAERVGVDQVLAMVALLAALVLLPGLRRWREIQAPEMAETTWSS